MNRILFSLFLALLQLTSASASHRYELYEVFVAPANGKWTLDVNEKAAFEITVLHNNIADADFEINYEISEDMMPECNGVIGTYGGSQGGYLSIAAASLHPDVKVLVAFFPAMSDLVGYMHGRAGGWPHMMNKKEYQNAEVVNTLKYYDTVNFARDIKVQGFYAFGYNDEVCPPTTTYSVYNTIDAPKQLLLAPTTEHYTFTEQYRDAVDWIVETLKNIQ